jgi:tetratricopeptide (TPR) repeat protein
MKIINDIKFNYLMISATLLMRLNKTERLITMLEANSRKFDAYHLLEKTLYIAYEKVGRWDYAIQTLTRLTEKYPELPIYAWNLGTLLMQLGRDINARQYFEKCVKYEPDNEHYLSSLAICYLYMEIFDKAEEICNKVVDIAPWNPITCYTLSMLYRVTARYEKIEGLLLGYIGKYPNLYIGYAYLGNYLQYLMNNPQDSLPWYVKSVALLRNPKAMKYLERYTLLDSWRYSVGDEYCEALISVGRKEKALRFVRKNIFFHPFDPSYRSSLIEYYLSAGEYRLAEQAAIKGLKNDPGRSEYLLFQSRSLLRQGRPAEALVVVEKLVSSPWSNASLWPVVGEAHEQLKDWRSAVDAYRKALEMNPFDIRALVGISAGLKKLGLFDQALIFAKKATILDPMNKEVK